MRTISLLALALTLQGGVLAARRAGEGLSPSDAARGAPPRVALRQPRPGVLLAQQKGKPDLPAGLTPDQVRARLGPPARVGRHLVAHRAVEQWHYGPPHNLRLTFDCPRGQTPRLVRIRTARAE